MAFVIGWCTACKHVHWKDNGYTNSFCGYIDEASVVECVRVVFFFAPLFFRIDSVKLCVSVQWWACGCSAGLVACGGQNRCCDFFRLKGKKSSHVTDCPEEIIFFIKNHVNLQNYQHFWKKVRLESCVFSVKSHPVSVLPGERMLCPLTKCDRKVVAPTCLKCASLSLFYGQPDPFS